MKYLLIFPKIQQKRPGLWKKEEERHIEKKKWTKISTFFQFHLSKWAVMSIISKGRIDPQIPLSIKHEDSKKDLCLNTADLFAWGIFRKYERRDYRWYNVFGSKIKFDDVYLK